MTTRWHLRGALRSGLSRDEIERVQCAVERVAAACGMPDLAEGMPRVADIADEEV
jgi:alkylhydroperoxidase/carboxymuconolactone decarboxylase family protein YurZ